MMDDNIENLWNSIDVELASSKEAAAVCHALREYVSAQKLGDVVAADAWHLVVRRLYEWELAQ